MEMIEAFKIYGFTIWASLKTLVPPHKLVVEGLLSVSRRGLRCLRRLRPPGGRTVHVPQALFMLALASLLIAPPTVGGEKDQ